MCLFLMEGSNHSRPQGLTLALVFVKTGALLIEAGCPDLSMRDNYRFGGDDFDDLTTNVQQRRALAIAKPISGGY